MTGSRACLDVPVLWMLKCPVERKEVVISVMVSGSAAVLTGWLMLTLSAALQLPATAGSILFERDRMNFGCMQVRSK